MCRKLSFQRKLNFSKCRTFYLHRILDSNQMKGNLGGWDDLLGTAEFH
jgi:hypothetical protein